MSRTIPRALLPHRVDYQAHTPGPDGNTYGTPIKVPARFEAKAKVVYFADGKTATASGLVFLPPHVTVPDPDPANPDPIRIGLEPTPDDRITHRTIKYRVLEVATMVLVNGQAHHHEVWVG